MKIKGIEISHPDKLLYPKDHFTKADVADYYAKISPKLLPFLKNRPLTLKIYPKGIHEAGFFNKHAPNYFPHNIKRIDVPMHSKQGHLIMVSATKMEDFVYWANQNMIELHMNLSTSKALEKPDQIIFDFDPSNNDFENVRACSFLLRGLLDKLKINSFIKVTGSRGVHVHIPIKGESTFKEIKPIAKKIAKAVYLLQPNLATLEQLKDKRKNRVFIDYLRNDYGMTAISPYSLRAKDGISVAAPISWEELKSKSLNSTSFNAKNILDRLSKMDDPWRAFNKKPVSIKTLIKHIEEL